MMIQAVLSNPSHPEYGVATIPFPIPHDQYARCMELLEALEIGDAAKADCKVEKVDSFYTVLKRTEMLTVNVEELNYLAKRLDSFDTGEAAQFQAMAHKLELFELKDLINLTFCCQQATVITDFSDLAAVGRNHYMNLHGGSASVDELNKLDGEETARQLIESGSGTITPYGVVYDNGMKLEQVYDGRFFPCYDKLDKAGKNSLKTEYKRLAACEKTLKKNEKAVQKVQTLLAKLPAAEDVMTKLSLTDKKNVTAAEKAYNPLTEDQRTFLTEDEHAKMQANSERMQTLIEGETLIKAAEKAIKSLPADTKIKATDSKKLETAQEAYDKVKNSEDGLTIDPKLAEKFETSRTAYYAYQQQAEDFRSEYLDALPENANAVTAEYETAIPAAQTAYKALSKNVQSFIEKAEVSHLKACEKTLKKNQSAAGKVDKLIAKLPADVSAEFTAKDEKAINAAWKAYSKLTSEQKTFLEDEQRLLDCYNKAYPEG